MTFRQCYDDTRDTPWLCSRDNTRGKKWDRVVAIVRNRTRSYTWDRVWSRVWDKVLAGAHDL